ncbi:MAG: S41 family peptidase [Lachnospiraceae bacterium]|nr:S41 family peptidase [Lachnospiraceae bacterium]
MEEKNNGFLKGFWVGFGVFLVCALLIGGIMVMQGIKGFERWQASQETEDVRPTKPSNSAKPTDPADPADPAGTDEADEYSAAAQRFEEVMEYVDVYFVLDYDKEEMINQALKAYVDASDDPYSEYMTAEELAKTMEDSDGSYCGIGVQIQQSTETMETTITRVFSNGSAMEEGMKAGDVIIRVGDEDVRKISIDDIVALVRGKEGTTVNVTVYRSWEDKEITFTLTRRPVQVDTVFYEMLTDKIAYLQLTEFDMVSVEQMEEALKALKKEGCEQLILDIRDDPGGRLDSVLDIADFFLKKDLLIMSMEDKTGYVTECYSNSKALFTGDLVVLANGYSASASEVLTGALKDHGRAVVMGEKTFGKGIVQGFFTLSDGSGIKLTTEHWMTPSGECIDKIGIEPDIEGADDPATEDVDELVEQAKEYLQKK